MEMYHVLAKACAETKAAGWKLRSAARKTESLEQWAMGGISKDRNVCDEGPPSMPAKRSGEEDVNLEHFFKRARVDGRTERDQDRSERERDLSRRAEAKAQADVEEERQRDLPSKLANTPRKLFVKRYLLDSRRGADDALRAFEDEPVNMPPVFCLLRGCEQHWFRSREELLAHCEEYHEGFQSYRLRVLHLLSRTVFQFPGSLQRAAMQNFAEFQCRSATQWENFSESIAKEDVGRDTRWGPKSWVACCVCTMQA